MQYVYLINLTPFFFFLKKKRLKNETESAKKKKKKKYDGRGRDEGGSWKKIIFAYFDNLKSLLGFLKCPVILVSGK